MKNGVSKVFEVGEVILIPLHNVDEAKVDAQNLTGVIVRIDVSRMLAQVVVKTGLLKQWYSYHELTHVVGKGNTIELLGLQEAYLGWVTMKVISEQEASRNESLVCGQGKGDVTCNFARWHVTQITAVASKQAGCVPLPVTATTPNAKTYDRGD